MTDLPIDSVAILADNSPLIPASLAEGLPICILPLTLTIDGHAYREGVDLTPEEFYRMLPTAKTIPHTAKATPNDFAEQYRAILERGAKGIVVLPLSAQISGTYESAVVAAQEFPGAPIEVIDSAQLSMAQGWLIVTGARAARAGLSLKEVVEIVQLVKERAHVMFMAETLDYLYKGGRISGVTHLVGTLLRFKPIIQMREGHMELATKVRSRRAGFEEMALIMDRILEGTRLAEIAMIDAGGKELNEEMSQFFAQHLDIPRERIISSSASAIIGVHSGPNTCGPNYYTAVPGFPDGIVRFP